jgi:hypothetical protein
LYNAAPAEIAFRAAKSLTPIYSREFCAEAQGLGKIAIALGRPHLRLDCRPLGIALRTL